MTLQALTASGIAQILKVERDESPDGSRLFILKALLADQDCEVKNIKTYAKETERDSLTKILKDVKININESNIQLKWDRWMSNQGEPQPTQKARNTSKRSKPNPNQTKTTPKQLPVVAARKWHTAVVMALSRAYGKEVALHLAEMPNAVRYSQYRLCRFRALSIVLDHDPWPTNADTRSLIAIPTDGKEQSREDHSSVANLKKGKHPLREEMEGTAHAQAKRPRRETLQRRDEVQCGTDSFNSGHIALFGSKDENDQEQSNDDQEQLNDDQEHSNNDRLNESLPTRRLRNLPASQFYVPNSVKDPTRVPHQGFNMDGVVFDLLKFTINPCIAQPSTASRPSYSPIYANHYEIEGSADSLVIYRWHGCTSTQSIGPPLMLSSDDKHLYYSLDVKSLPFPDLSESIKRSEHWRSGNTIVCLGLALPIVPAEYGCYSLLGCLIPQLEVSINLSPSA